MGFMSFLTLSDDGNEVRSTIEQIELGGQLYVTRLVRVNSFRSKLSSLLADEEGPSSSLNLFSEWRSASLPLFMQDQAFLCLDVLSSMFWCNSNASESRVFFSLWLVKSRINIVFVSLLMIE